MKLIVVAEWWMRRSCVAQASVEPSHPRPDDNWTYRYLKNLKVLNTGISPGLLFGANILLQNRWKLIKTHGLLYGEIGLRLKLLGVKTGVTNPQRAAGRTPSPRPREKTNKRKIIGLRSSYLYTDWSYNLRAALWRPLNPSSMPRDTDTLAGILGGQHVLLTVVEPHGSMKGPRGPHKARGPQVGDPCVKTSHSGTKFQKCLISSTFLLPASDFDIITGALFLSIKGVGLYRPDYELHLESQTVIWSLLRPVYMYIVIM